MSHLLMIPAMLPLDDSTHVRSLQSACADDYHLPTYPVGKTVHLQAPVPLPMRPVHWLLCQEPGRNN